MNVRELKNTVTVPCIECGETCRASITEDPGVHTFGNGDPGYPGSTEVDWSEVCKCAHWEIGNEIFLDSMENQALEARDELLLEDYRRSGMIDDAWPDGDD